MSNLAKVLRETFGSLSELMALVATVLVVTAIATQISVSWVLAFTR